MGEIILKSSSTPSTPSAGYGSLYEDSADKLLKFKNQDGNIYDVSTQAYPMQGRLTLGSGSPVTSASLVTSGTLYYTPYLGNWHTWFDSGSVAHTTQFSEISLTLSVTSGSVYDVFCVGGSALELLKWSTTTARATNIIKTSGLYTKSGDITRMYLGTICASGTNTCEDSTTNRYLWNYYNRIPRMIQIYEQTQHTYTSPVRLWNGATTNNVSGVVIGAIEDCAYSSIKTTLKDCSNTQITLYIDGSGFTLYNSYGFRMEIYDTTTNCYEISARHIVPLGYHYFNIYEFSVANATFYRMSLDQVFIM